MNQNIETIPYFPGCSEQYHKYMDKLTDKQVKERLCDLREIVGDKYAVAIDEAITAIDNNVALFALAETLFNLFNETQKDR